MPVIDHGGDKPELLLMGADRPRPLPPELRGLLEGLLMAGPARACQSDTGAGRGAIHGEDAGALEPRRLPALARYRLVTSLSTDAEGRPRTSARRWALAPSGLAAAAVVVVALAVGVPVLARPGGPGPGLSALGQAGAAQRVLARPPGALYVVHADKAASGAGGVAVAPNVAPGPGPGVPAPANKTSRHTSVAARPTKARKGAVDNAYEMGVPVAALVAGVQPSGGLSTGGTWALLTGTGLSRVTAVYFGAARAPRVEVLSPLEVRVLVPAHGPGLAPIAVVTTGRLPSGGLTPARYRFRAAG